MKYKFGVPVWVMEQGEAVKKEILMVSRDGYVFKDSPFAPPLAEDRVFETKQQAEQQLSRALLLIAERI